MTRDFRTLPADEHSAATLASQGLTYAVVGDSAEQQDAFSQAVSRGFYGTQLTDERLGEERPRLGETRSVGVYDDSAAEPSIPVATVDSWVSPLTMPGGGALESWAISAVTVAPTHRRRGIARALLEGELRTARDGGIPLAVLTVSESTIYGRYRFGPATWAAELIVDTKRAGWAGPTPAGRLHLVSRESAREWAPAIEERARTHGSIARWGGHWNRQLGLRPSDASSAAGIRVVRYDDESGAAQGVAIYKVKDAGPDFTKHPVEIVELIAATDDAYAALWRYLLELDLVSEVKAWERSVAEPVRFMVADARAVLTRSVTDHLWTRILDLHRCLEGRTWQQPGRIVLEVHDDFGFAEGRVALDVDADGAATVTDTGEEPDVVLGIADLGSLLLGGVSPVTLAAAGKLSGHPTALERLHRMAVTPTPPVLSFWF